MHVFNQVLGSLAIVVLPPSHTVGGKYERYIFNTAYHNIGGHLQGTNS